MNRQRDVRREDGLAYRSWLMSRVRKERTRPESILRRELRRAGFRQEFNVKTLPGSPDIVVSEAGRAIFVHGCFWHSHACSRGSRPRTNKAFWNKKLDANEARDKRNQAAVRRAGWKVSVVWQCTLKRDIPRLLNRLRKDRPRSASLNKRQKMTSKKSS